MPDEYKINAITLGDVKKDEFNRSIVDNIRLLFPDIQDMASIVAKRLLDAFRNEETYGPISDSELEELLLHFYSKALSATLSHPAGQAMMLKISGHVIGKAGAESRSKPRADFQRWAREKLTARTLSYNELARIYCRDVQKHLNYATVRAWLTPSGGWDASAAVEGA